MYGGKSKYTRRYARKGRKGKVAQLAKGKVTSVQALAKSVRSIQRSLRTKSEYLNYRQFDNVSITADCTVVNLSNYAGWTDVFGTGANDDTQNRMIHKSFGMDIYITLENTINEPDTTQFTVMLVSLKDDIGASFNAGTGALNLANGFQYSINGGLAMVNKKMFKVHKTKRMVLTNHGASLAISSAQTQGGTDKRFYWKARPNTMITNPLGDWKSLSSAGDPSKQYYLLVFNDNSAIDLQNPKLSYNVIHTVQTVA